MHPLLCKTPRDVLILLKSSVLIAEDLDLALKLSLRPMLNLVRFHDLKEGMFFRCFIKNKKLVGISQKDTSISHEFLHELEPIITEKAEDLLKECIEKLSFDDFSIDFYIHRLINIVHRLLNY